MIEGGRKAALLEADLFIICAGYPEGPTQAEGSRRKGFDTTLRTDDELKVSFELSSEKVWTSMCVDVRSI